MRYSLYSSCCSTGLQGHPSLWFSCYSKANMRLPVSDQ